MNRVEVGDCRVVSGTVGEMAESLGRRWFGCDLNPDYGKLARERTAQAGLPYRGTS